MKFTGKVVHGMGRGKKIGFKTINLAISDFGDGEVDLGGLEFGIYAVLVDLVGSVGSCGGGCKCSKRKIKGVMNFGPRPSFSEKTPQVEIHLLDFDGDLYGEIVTFEVLKRLRSVIKFNSVDLLKAQISKDISETRTLFDGLQL